ncbi:MAG: DUF4394 domain-containing protein [Pedobacter sp.]|nr:DUF4394 domain-containing protein [Pedobacter sp.]MDQ8054537.1 DUF4394 domain-containing protein [Pedobacter sp.]
MLTCKKEAPYYNLPIFGRDQVFYALTAQNTLARYNAKDVRTNSSVVNISGLAAGESLISIDFRPATGELYGISSLNKLYLVDIGSGGVRAVSSTPFYTTTLGSVVNMDFNPADDRIRIVSNGGQNLRINPETGALESTDTNLSVTSISAIAHHNNYAGTTTSTLFDIDAAAKKLYRQDPNLGTLTNIGNLTLDMGTQVAFDISSANKALAVSKPADSTKLYVIDLNSGKTELAGKFALGTNIRSIAIPTLPVAYAVDQANTLIIFNPTVAPTYYTRAITGLQSGESILGMDVRPLNGQLYALGSSSRLYRLNVATGAATLIGTGPFGTILSGTSFGFDFNPLTDVIRVVSNTGQNMRIDPNTARVTSDTNFAATANFSAAAFSNNFRTASSTLLYLIDHNSNKLLTQNLSSGVLTAVGDLKIDLDAANGFDILYQGQDVAYGIFSVGGKTGLYTINLTTGEATLKYEINRTISAFATGLRFN